MNCLHDAVTVQYTSIYKAHVISLITSLIRVIITGCGMTSASLPTLATWHACCQASAVVVLQFYTQRMLSMATNHSRDQ